MGVARFVFLSGPGAGRITGRPAGGGVIWTLVTANNRTLGRGYHLCEDYRRCRESVAALQEQFARVEARINAEDTGRFGWWAYVDNTPVARSHRAFLRAHECGYNLDRFREAVPLAMITEGTRVISR